MVEATRTATQPYLDRGDWSDRTLDSYLSESATRRPDELALVQGGTRLTYRELSVAVDAALRGLTHVGTARQDVVCVMLPNWWEAMVAMQAVLAMGAVVNPVVPIYRDHEVGFILRQARPSVVLVPHRFRGFDFVAMMERLLPTLEEPPSVVVIRPEGALPAGFLSWGQLMTTGEQGEPDTGRTVAADDIALLLYTSGTTADPKGVLHSHQTLDYENRSMIRLLGLGRSDTVFMPSPVTHITGFLYGILLPSLLGVASVLLDVWQPETAHGLIEDERCRFTLAATPFLLGLVEQYEKHGAPSMLRTFPCGGADVPPSLVRRARAVMGTAVTRVYGSSEFPTFSCGRPEDDELVAAETDGQPIGPVEHRLDGVTDGVGELLIRGPDMFLGYLDPALNLAAFTEDGFFRTGDLASVNADGAITIHSRLKDIIVRGGEKISAKDVEDRLFTHAAVHEVAVVGMPDPVLGERVCAFVVPTPGATPTLGELIASLVDQGVARQKHPERLVLVGALPKTASGKVQKFVLRSQAAGRPEGVDPTHATH
ncbi:MAG: acid--CoA ligase [Frankiales bacterium]|nr:acid--CoA ligase [Frankiales bacterium]